MSKECDERGWGRDRMGEAWIRGCRGGVGVDHDNPPTVEC
jgi:hypothetical protein